MTISTANGTAPAQKLGQPAGNKIPPRFRGLAKRAVKSKSPPTDLFEIADRRSEVRIYQCILDIISDDAVIDVEAAADEPSLLNSNCRRGSLSHWRPSRRHLELCEEIAAFRLQAGGCGTRANDIWNSVRLTDGRLDFGVFWPRRGIRRG